MSKKNDFVELRLFSFFLSLSLSAFFDNTHVGDQRRPLSQRLGSALDQGSGELGERRRRRGRRLRVGENRGGEDDEDNKEASFSSSPRPHRPVFALGRSRAERGGGSFPGERERKEREKENADNEQKEKK